MRSAALLRLLESVKLQSYYPDEILIIDGSVDNTTKDQLILGSFENMQYFLVDEHTRGLTKQRNFGIQKVGTDIDIVGFLDDDTVLENTYVENILNAFQNNPDAIGVGGVAINENKWKTNDVGVITSNKYYTFEEFYIKESARNYVRNIFGLGSDQLPGVMPEFSHGRTFSYPLTGKDYPVDLIVGMSMNFKKSVFDHIRFSTFFEGYGLYEDADFSLRALRYGQNYIATSAQLAHLHDSAGRPNKFSYGKMVVRNGWYVWRIKYPNPSLNARLKWHAITLLLAFIRLLNSVSTDQKKAAFTESMGRFAAWMTLWYKKPAGSSPDQ
jgi:GT2 family glycosyltransferase